MTGYESKRAAAHDKLIQDAFDEWWDSNRKTLSPSNPCMTDSFEYWAWEGWHAALELTSTKCEVQPEQEPVAYDKTEMNGFVQDLYDKKMQEGKHGHYETMFHVVHQAIKRATPPQRPWVDLTDDEIWTLHDSYPNPVEFARAIEQLSKEKNL